LTKASNAEPAPRVPRPLAGCDVRNLPITPRDAFLLSRVDGSSNELDLAAMTGVPYEAVRAGIDRLVSLGALEIDSSSEAPHQSPSHTRSGIGVGARHTSQTHMKAVVEPGEAQESSDLDPERRRKVLDLFANLGERDYYALLGVVPTAEKREIKRAYYALAPDYHPDKFFGKRLGSYKPKMEAIFAHLTYAYETLSSAERRAEYDAYLAAQQQTRSIEELLSSTPAEPAGTASPAGPLSVGRVPVSVPAPRSGSSPSFDGRPATVPPGSSPPRTPQDEKARRLALARKLGVTRSSVPPERRSKPPQVPPSDPSNPAAAAQELKRMREASIDQGRRSQVRRYIESAEAALKDNPAAAANAYRLALTIEPNNPEIIHAHEQASQLAAVALAGGYLKQAEYEARSGHWREAARSYSRAAAGMPNDPAVLHNAAYALLKAGSDFRMAGDFAKRAVAAAPKGVEARITLIEVYIAAAMPLAARRELEAARELAPRDDRLNELVKRLR